MKSIFVKFVLAGLLAGLLPIAAYAATWSVSVGSPGTCNTGDPNCATIQAAVNAASTGDTINVAAGTYDGGISLNQSVILQGPNAGVNPNTGTRVAEAIIDSGSPAIRISTTDPVTINGFTFSGTGTPIDSYTTGNTPTIENNIITKISGGNLFFANSGNFIFENNELSQLDPNPNGEGMQLAGNWNGTNGTVVTITGNVWENYVMTGINASDVSGTISNNTFSNISYYGILVANNSSSLTISGNTFENITNPDSTVATWGAGVRFYTPALTGSVTITGNTFTNDFVGVAVRPDSTADDLSKVVVNGNIFSGDATGVINAPLDSILNATGNWWGDASGPSDLVSTDSSNPLTNPSGTGSPAVNNVDYSNWCVNSGCTTPAPTTVQVHIFKYIDEVQATTANTNSAVFPMETTFSSPNLGSVTNVPFTLSPTGWGSTDSAYEASFVGSNAGANYEADEVLGGAVVGTTCGTGQPFMLAGYSVGDTLTEAQSATQTTTAPTFTNLQSDHYIIVWNKDCLPAPALLSPVNGTITTTAGLVSVNWNSVTDSAGGITYVYQSSNSSAVNPDGSFVSPAYTSGSLTATSIPTLSTPAGVYYWHVQAKDADGNLSPWSNVWTFTIDNSSPAQQATCPAGTSPTLVETVPVDSSLSAGTHSTNALSSSQTYLLVSSGTWQNGGLNAADTEFASVDNWATHMAGYNIAPYMLGAGEFQLQVDNGFVSWGSYNPAHQYSYLYTGTGSSVGLGVFDGDSTATPPTPNPDWYGDNSGSLNVSIYSCNPTTGSLTVEKDTNGGNGTFTFTSNIPNGSNFSITTTSGKGDSQTFTNLAPGTYNVTETNIPKGWIMTDNECASAVVTAGGAVTCVITNTNNKLLGEIRGTKYEDRDGDGKLNDGDHHRLSGWTINLTKTGSSAIIASTVTDKFGNYRFSNLVAGTYSVSEAGQPGWIETYPASKTYTINLLAGKISKKNDFGNFKLGTISGMKYNDLNSDGRKESKEPGLSGWTVVLKGPGGQTKTATTDANGNYSFTGLSAGTYTLSEVAQNSWRQTDHPGKIVIQSGTVSKNDDFGNTQKVQSSGRGGLDFFNGWNVWNPKNK